MTPCRLATDDQLPRNAKALAKAATGNGWRAVATYAHGTNLTSQGEPSSLVESIRVRLRHQSFAAVGAWDDGKFAFGYVWSRWTSPHKVGARELSSFVKSVTS